MEPYLHSRAPSRSVLGQFTRAEIRGFVRSVAEDPSLLVCCAVFTLKLINCGRCDAFSNPDTQGRSTDNDGMNI